jgi:hypothetical protein
MGLLLLAHRSIQCAEPTVAVGLERAPAACLGEGEGLSVVGLGGHDVRGGTTHGNVAKEVEGIRLVALLLTLAMPP